MMNTVNMENVVLDVIAVMQLGCCVTSIDVNRVVTMFIVRAQLTMTITKN
jgi:hypothetical protein